MFSGLKNFRVKKNNVDLLRGMKLEEASLPEGVCLYVVGDIHGRYDLLSQLITEIQLDSKTRKPKNLKIILLGDYVDRGASSKEVIDYILNFLIPSFDLIALEGNHEESMKFFLEHPLKNKRWLHYGGEATLRSYGIEFPINEYSDDDIKLVHKELALALPDTHSDFLANLSSHYSIGDYYFAHAGIRPGVLLEEQSDRDLRWIRGEFLNHDGLYEKIIVHGHNITDKPEFKENRIGIDTGAFYSNRLTCLVLEGDKKEIL